MTLEERLRRYRRTWTMAAAGARVFRQTGLLAAVSPIAGAKFVRRVRKTGSKGPYAVLHLHALNDPLRPAVVSGEVRLTYGELDARTNRLAHGLHGLGVGPGDRVGALLRNGNEHLELTAALGHLSATAVQIGYRLKPKEVAYILENSGARALVFHSAYAPLVEEALAELKGGPAGLRREACIAASGPPPQGGGPLPRAPGFMSYEELLRGGDPDEPPQVRGNGGGLMVYTSGTTGRSKGANRDFGRSGLEPVIHFIAELPLRHDDRHLCICPLYHSAAPAFVALTLFAGGCVVIVDHFDPPSVLRTMERERITSSLMVPTMYNRLVELGLPAIRKYDLSHLRWLMSGAAPLPTELARRIEEAFGPILYNFYGATETGLVTLAKPGEHTVRPGTIGKLIGGNQVRFLDDQGHDVPEGEVGELYVKNAMLVGGYHGNDEATRAAQRDGYFSVGDLARRDSDGYYYLADRKHDMVISGGVNIYPFEIEQRLHQHPAVSEVAVAGVPDPEWGESLVAFVVLREGATATVAELQAFVTAELADYKRPRRVIFLDALPRTPTGKVLKRELRASLVAAPGSGTPG
ncbi:MAG: AMP-dependent synthetase [Myxococcales bacterium]|nr:AMP-dependent synthetase [Myxococcales bacterium]